MGLRDRFFELLSRGAEPEVDPDEMVDVIEVDLARAPLLRAALEDADIESEILETSFVPQTPLTRARVRVRRADVAAATTVLDELD